MYCPNGANGVWQRGDVHRLVGQQVARASTYFDLI